MKELTAEMLGQMARSAVWQFPTHKKNPDGSRTISAADDARIGQALLDKLVGIGTNGTSDGFWTEKTGEKITGRWITLRLSVLPSTTVSLDEGDYLLLKLPEATR
jgi:hypothetical protein